MIIRQIQEAPLSATIILKSKILKISSIGWDKIKRVTPKIQMPRDTILIQPIPFP